MKSVLPSPKRAAAWRWLNHSGSAWAIAGLLCLAASSATAATSTVYVVDYDFTSSLVGKHYDPVIILGDDVHWIWSATNFSSHSTTAAAGELESRNSGLQSAPSTFDQVFTAAGTFNYYCLLHGFDAGGATSAGCLAM